MSGIENTMLRKSGKRIKRMSLETSVAVETRKISLETAWQQMDENKKNIHSLQEGEKRTYKVIHKQPQATVEVVKEGKFRQICHANLTVAERGRKQKQLKAVTAKVEHMTTLNMVSTTQAKAQQVRMLENMLEKIKMKATAARNMMTMHSKLRNHLLEEYNSSMRKFAELEEIVNLKERDLENVRGLQEQAIRAQKQSMEKYVSTQLKYTKEARKQTRKLSIKDRQLATVKEKQEEALGKLIASEHVNHSPPPAGIGLNTQSKNLKQVTPSADQTYQQDEEAMEHLRVRLKMDEIDFASNHEKLVYLKNNHSQLIFHEPLHKASLAMREAELQECLAGLQSRQAEALAAFFRASHVYAELLHGISALYSKLRGILMTTPYSFCDEEDKGSKGSEAERLEHRSLIKSLKGEHDAHPGRVHEADFVETPTSNGLDPMEMLEFCEERLLQLSAATVDVSVDLHDAAVKEKIQNLLEWDVQLEWHNCRINIGQQQQSEETMLSDEDEEDEGNSAPTNADIKMWGQRLIAMSARSSKKSNKRAKT